MANTRFSGNLNHYYDEIMTAWPYRKELFDALGMEIKSYCSQNEEMKKISVLEIGSGSGGATIKIIKSDKRIILTAVEPDQEMIRKLEERLGNKYIKRISIINEFAEEYLKKTESGYYDIFASSWTLHNFQLTERYMIIEEAYRVLKPGGLFVMLDKMFNYYPHQDYDYFREQMKRIDNLQVEPEIKEELKRHEEKDKSLGYMIEKPGFIRELEFIHGFTSPRIVLQKGLDNILKCYKK